MLAQVPAFSEDDHQLIYFLEKRWLAKSTGFFASMVDWICPCFGISVQVHPETTGCCYARSPWIKQSPTYINRIEDWKKSLPHPQKFPLVLTRPFDIREFLPSCIEVAQDESLSKVIEKIAACSSPIIVDLTDVLMDEDREEWLTKWEAYRDQLSCACQNRGLNLTDIFCIERHQQPSIGGIRLLPLAAEEVEQQHRLLLDWISIFGLSANFIELDRWTSPPTNPVKESKVLSPSKEECISFLRSFTWESDHPQKNLMVEGTLQVLNGLFEKCSEEKWNDILRSPTRSAIVQLSLSRIEEQLRLLAQEEMSFFELTGHIEQIHANLSSLLEIVSPFNAADFPAIYQNLLISIPQRLKSLKIGRAHV